ncbi:transcriptional elongation regulator MINIYO [Curcuma longa]|uniref:transcriptional elongation regulator MINIYO n=1 Tax=Curcuma longa TaxID=136217 RepID=UPI003D9F48CA
MESDKPAKGYRTSQKSTGSSTAFKKIVHELHHAPGLVGGIVEKGFSSSGNGNSSTGIPSTIPLPRSTVLPFPVARHRSHGPHWAPLGSAPIEAEEGDMEEDKDETDYDPIATYANPIERKEKKPLDFSKWKEVVSQDGASLPQSNNVAKADAGRKREVKKSGVVNYEKNGNLPSSTSNSACKPEKDQLLSRELMNGRVTEKFTLTTEPKSMTSKLESEEADENGVGSASSISSIAAWTEKHSDSGDIEMSEANCYGSSSFMDDIDAENLSLLKNMSAEEISEAQTEILEKMNPSVLEMLKKRGQSKLRSRKVIGQGESDGRQKVSSIKPVDSGKSATTVDPSGARTSKIESNNSSWKSWSERVEKVRSLRFSLDGNLLGADSTHNILNGGGSKVGPYNAENVTERDLLRTEGDPAAAGYTINEAVALTRSMIPGQRAIALHLIVSILNKALCNLQQMDNDYHHVRGINPSDNLVDWQAVWAFALGPEPQMAISLRIALDDNHDSVVLNCVKAIQSILCFDMNENFFDFSEKSTASKKNTFTAPVFRSRPDIDGGFLHGGYWKYNTKSSNILPNNYKNNEDDENEGNRTIQDDIFVSEQDVAAGLIRMGILPRICCLLEMDPLAALEESLLSIVVAIARHSPTCADAVWKCPSLIQTVVKIFTKKGLVDPYPSQIKVVLLLKVLSEANKEICWDFVRCGLFRQVMWNWYKPFPSLEKWMESGRENCKLTSALMVQQLRLWKVCIQFGFCITYFTDFFTALCLWLGPPMFNKLISNNLLSEFTSITREAYLVLETLAEKLPTLHAGEQINNRSIGFSDDTSEAWSWNDVCPMVDLAVRWLQLRDIPYICSLTSDPKKNVNHLEFASISCIIWVISAALHMLCGVFHKLAPNIHDELDNKITSLPRLSQFVPNVGLNLVKNGFLNFSGSSKLVFEACSTETGSLVNLLCLLRQQGDLDVSLSSSSCLHALVQLALLIDDFVQRARNFNDTQSFSESMSGLHEKILNVGLIKSAHNELEEVLTMFMDVVSSKQLVLQSLEMFDRGGPAPGIGFGWGCCGGGFWSSKVLLAQTDAQLILSLLHNIPVIFENDQTQIKATESVSYQPDQMLTLERINSILQLSLLAGPGNETILEKAWDYLFQASVMKYLGSFVAQYFCRTKVSSSFDWHYGDEDYYLFSKMLDSHYKERWLIAKRKTISEMNSNNRYKTRRALETIQETEPHSEFSRDQSTNALMVEWAHQRLPLPMHWFLSAICIMGDARRISTCSPTDLDVAKSGLFFLLGLEVSSIYLCSSSAESPISGVPLIWKLHALSMALSQNMDVLMEEKSMNIFKTLQDIYGQHIDEKLQGFTNSLPEAQNNVRLEILNFQAIHDSYSTFVEHVAEQFCALSYGDIIYGRQVAVYLHRKVEPTIRLAMWNALSNLGGLELLPPIEKCIANAEGYLEPVEDREDILESYSKSWTSGILNKAALRGSISFTIASHHLSSFLFNTNSPEKVAFRNKLVKSLLRSHLQKPQDEAMLLSLVQYGLTTSEDPTHKSEATRRLAVLKEACGGNSSLVALLEKLDPSAYD